MLRTARVGHSPTPTGVYSRGMRRTPLAVGFALALLLVEAGICPVRAGQSPAPTPAAPSAAPDAALVERARKAARAAAEFFAGAEGVPAEPYASYADKPAELGVAGREELRIDGPGGTPVTAWFVPPRRGPAKGTVVVLHGWGSNVGFALSQSAFLLDHGYALLLVEARANAFARDRAAYRGFLREDVADLAAALAALQARPGVDARRIALYGFSYGAAKALVAGAELTGFRAVIADAAPLPRGIALQRFEERMPPAARKDPRLIAAFFEELDAALLARVGYTFTSLDVAAAAAAIAPRPLLLLHGRDDEIVPVAATEALAARAPSAKVVYGAAFGHCLGMQRAPAEYVPAVVGFLDAALR